MDIKECFACRAPCYTTETPERKAHWVDDTGFDQTTHHHSLQAFRYVGLEQTIDDVILLQELEKLKEDFEQEYRSSGGFGNTPLDRKNYRKLQTIRLTIEKLKTLMGLK
jgi:hypothetical protein